MIDISAYENSREYYSTNNYPTATWGYSGGVELGVEFRKKVGGKVIFFHGPGISYSYSDRATQIKNPTYTSRAQIDHVYNTRVSIPYVVGYYERMSVTESFTL